MRPFPWFGKFKPVPPPSAALAAPVKHHYFVTYSINLKNGCFDFAQCRLTLDEKIDYTNYQEQLDIIFTHVCKTTKATRIAVINFIYLGAEEIKEEPKSGTPEETK